MAPRTTTAMPADGRPAWAGRYATERTAACLAEFGTRCHLCGAYGATTADHLVPRAAGGSDDLDNLRPAHQSCNSARQDMPLADWFRLHPLISRDGDAPPSRRWFLEPADP